MKKSITPIKSKKETPLQTQGAAMLARARTMAPILTDADYETAGQFILGGKDLIAKIAAFHKSSVDAAHKAHKEAIALRDNQTKPIKDALAIVEPKVLAYKQQRERIERERAALAAQAELERNKATLAIAADFGDAEDVAQRELALAPKRPTPPPPAVPKIAGLSTRKKWTFDIIAPREVKREFCIPDDDLIGIKVDGAFHKVSKVTPEMIAALEAEIGGIKVFMEEGLVGRRQ